MTTSAYHRTSISRRLFITVLVFSSIVTLAVTAYRVYADYQEELAATEREIELVYTSFLPNLTEALWKMDTAHLQLQLEGMLYIPYVEHAAIWSKDAVLLSAGSHKSEKVLERRKLLSYIYNERTVPLGDLVLSIDIGNLHRKVYAKLVSRLIYQGFIVFLVSLFLYGIVRRMITDPLSAMAEQISHMKIGGKDAVSVLVLSRGAFRAKEDELDQVAAAINALSTNLQHKFSEIEAKNAELERFTYTVSHDLKSPIITIKGFLGLLVSDARAGNFGRMEADIRRIENAADKMQALLDDLLQLSRIGRIANPPSVFSMTELAHEAVELMHGSIQSGKVELVIDPAMPTVYADSQRVREVLQNIIENAVKYLGDQAAPRIEVGCRVRSGENVFFVKDNGIGIDPKFHEKIFGLFDKLDPASPGTGIGLALVKRIVELHNGKIWVESEGIGAGSTFCFTLPAAAPDKGGQDDRNDAHDSSGGRQ